MWYERPLCHVVPVSACSTPRGAKARCAECGSVSVVHPSAVARISSAWSAHASTRLSIGARAQHALAADAASRRARSCVFQRRYLLQCLYDLSAAPLKRNPLGESSAKRVPITNCTFWCFATRMLCCHEGTNRTWDQGPLCRVIPSTLSQPCVVRLLVVLTWFCLTPGTHQRDSNARYATWFRVP